jgi:hypothetical protein
VIIDFEKRLKKNNTQKNNMKIPGRPRLQYNLQKQNDKEREYLIEQLENYIDQQARRKFLEKIQMNNQQKQFPQEINGPGFAFLLPQYNPSGFSSVNDDIEFAATPFDPRYYEPSPPQEEQQSQNFEDFDEQVSDDDLPLESEIGVKSTSIEAPLNENRNKILIPSPMHVNDVPSYSSLSSGPLLSAGESQSQRILHRAQQKQQQLLQQQLLNKQADVQQKPLQVEFDNTTSLYIVALIAGLSCAFSTGVSNPFYFITKHLIDVILLIPIDSAADCTCSYVLFKEESQNR